MKGGGTVHKNTCLSLMEVLFPTDIKQHIHNRNSQWGMKTIYRVAGVYDVVGREEKANY